MVPAPFFCAPLANLPDLPGRRFQGCREEQAYRGGLTS